MCMKKNDILISILEVSEEFSDTLVEFMKTDATSFNTQSANKG